MEKWTEPPALNSEHTKKAFFIFLKCEKYQNIRVTFPISDPDHVITDHSGRSKHSYVAVCQSLRDSE